jgi:DNA primase catalytic core
MISLDRVPEGKSMTRIPETELERLKREASIEELARARGIKLKRHGADLLGLCPFHEDHAPSLVISPGKNLWHCLGACQQGGSVIDWVMKAEGVSFREAVERLQGQLPSLAASSAKRVSHSAAKRTPTECKLDDEEGLLSAVVSHYHETLKASPEARAYLERRGLRCDQMIDRFRLGYADGTVHKRFAGDSERLRTVGILRQTGQEHLGGCLVIPVLDEEGRVSEMYGRRIRDGVRPGAPVHLYLPGSHRGVFNIDALRDSKEIILCEALIDALTFWCAGFRNVTSSYGVEGFTSDHLAAFKRYGTKRVLIAYDRDDAGDKAAVALARKLIAQGIECYRVQFPRGMDANEYALKVQPAEKSLELVIRKAMWMGEGPPPIRSLEKARATKGEASSHPLAAAPAPAAPQAVVPAEMRADEIVLRFDDRRYRVRGLARNQGLDQLRINLLCARGERFHVDTLDLYSARQRLTYLKHAATELQVEEEVLKEDLARLMRKLEQLQEAERRRAQEPRGKGLAMSDEERAEAMALLKEPKLLARILADFELCGVVGEETSKLVGYLAAVSRKLEEPLAIIIQSSSAAGKTSLMEAILAFAPEEERVKYSAMTGQSLFYMGETDLKHKVLAIVEETGAERASYALKLLQSEGELTIASTGKDPTTGRLVTHEYRVEGTVMILLTTTAVEIDEELLNRCLVLTVNEGRDQTRAIHRLQRERETLEGLLARQDRERILRVHRNAQRLLRPLLVANPYARELTFLDDKTRTRRDHLKYLTLIRSIALLHQHQRPVKTVEHNGITVSYIEVTLDDIAIANRLAHEVLGRSLDELAPQTRRLLVLLEEMVTAECERLGMTRSRSEYRFTRRDVREHTGWSYEQVRVHLDRLVRLEYVLVHHGSRGQTFVYELVYDGKGKNGHPFLMGLLDVEELRRRSGKAETLGGPEASLGGPKAGFGGSLGAHTGPIGGPLGSPEPERKPHGDAELRAAKPQSPEKGHQGAALPSLAAGAVR